MQDPRAAGLGQELRAKADEAPSRNEDIHPNPAAAVIDERLRSALPEREQLGQDAEVLLGRVDRDTLDRLVHLSVYLPRHDLRLADRQLEAFTSHLLHEDRQLQLATSLYLPGVR